MIPKKLFFIWIGRDIPKYVYFSMDAFKKMNDGFDIELVHIPQLFGSNNADVIETKEKLKDYKKSMEIVLYSVMIQNGVKKI